MNIDGIVTTVSLCYISDDLTHDTSFVWALQQKLVVYLKNTFPHIKDLEYYSDGCAAQYKNYKNLLNLTYHFEDFNLSGTWNFFASCHGKSNCDGVGAAAKRKLRNKSLTVGPQDAILSSDAAFKFLEEAMPTVKFYHISKDSMQETRFILLYQEQ